MKKIFVFDPTASDKLSSVRGIGRYLQILKENFSNEFEFVSDLGSVTPDPYNVFINPFFNFLQKPVRTGLDLSLQGRRIAQKQIAIIHDLIPLKYPSHFPFGIKGSIYILLNKLALKNYDLIITDSEASKQDIINILGIRENKIRVIYPCLPKCFTNSQSVIRNRKINQLNNDELRITNYCLYVGDATWNKNLVTLARAIKIANINCVLVGKVFDQKVKVASEEATQEAKMPFLRQSPGAPVGVWRSKKTVSSFSNSWQHELKEFIELTKDDKRFIFAGYVPDSELIKLYEHALFNILPSRDEGFGFSFVESANFGCPSLLSDIPVLREVSAGNAIFFDQNNPQDIADKINIPNKNKIGSAAKKRSEFFSPEKFKKEFLSII